MKRISQYLTSAALSGLVCLALSLPANAQHRGGGGGGGGHFSGGGGGSHPSFGGGGARSVVPSNRGTFNGGARASVGVQHGNVAPRVGYAAGQRPYVGGNVRVGVGVGVGVRGGVGYGGRGYYGGGVRAGFGFGGGFHYNRGYYNSYYAPRLGFSVGFLPYGYYPFYWGDYEYFYSGGLYYQYNDQQYTVVEPPVGADISTLPSNAQSIVINGTQFYEANGVYYQPTVKDDGTTTYQIAGKDGQLNTGDPNGNNQQAPQIGDLVQQLPQDTRKINLNGVRYYVSQDGYYYQDTVDNNGNKAYKIVGTPTDEPNQ